MRPLVWMRCYPGPSYSHSRLAIREEQPGARLGLRLLLLLLLLLNPLTSLRESAYVLDGASGVIPLPISPFSLSLGIPSPKLRVGVDVSRVVVWWRSLILALCCCTLLASLRDVCVPARLLSLPGCIV